MVSRSLLPFCRGRDNQFAVQQLEPPDTHHLNAAAGWLDLNNPGEARRELSQLSARHHDHPAALELRWQICAAEKNWTEALEAARQLVQVDAENPSGWIHQSYSLHELKRTQEARDCLLPLVEKFPDLGTVPYNLACYACQLGDLEEARHWLNRAIKRRTKEDIRQAALADPDLKPMWEEIEKL